MKARGIGFFEQNIEKLVLGGVGLAFLGVVVMQFMYEPNRITVGNDNVSPGDAYAPVETKAQDLNAKIDRANLPEGMPEPPRSTPIKEFEARRQASVIARATISPLGRASLINKVDLGETPGTTSDKGGQVQAFAAPAPVNPQVFAYGVTIDPSEVAVSPELAKAIPAQQPFDVFPVSVEATIDGTALATALAADPDGEAGPLRAMPSGWWRNNFEVLGVRLQRQERQADGSWGPEVDVAPLPGKVDLIQLARESTELLELNAVVADARRLSEYVLRQDFYSTIAGDEWLPPAEAAKSIAVLSQDLPPAISQKFQAQQRLRRDIDLKKARLVEMNKPAASTPTPGTRGAPSAPPVDPRTGEAREDPRKKNLEAEIKKLEDQERKAIQELITLGYLDQSALPKTPGVVGAGGDNRGDMPTAEKPLLENSAVRVWAHDLSTKPGKTYRYRVLVVTNNPLFGKGAHLAGEQQTLATQAIARGTPSEWTPPVNVLDTRYLVVSGASDGSTGPGRVSATFDIYEFHYGFYRKGSTQLEAGDQFDATITPNDPNRRPIFELAKLKTDDGQPVQITFPAPEAAEVPGGTPPPVPLPEFAVPGPKDLKVTAPMYLLDVARVMNIADQGVGSGGGSTVVTLVDDEGKLTKRYANKDLTSDLLKRVNLSVKLGESQGDLQSLKGPSDQPKIVKPKKPDNTPSDDGGGAGGG